MRHSPPLLLLCLRVLLLHIAINFPVSSCRSSGLNLSFSPYSFTSLIQGNFPSNTDLSQELEKSGSVCQNVVPIASSQFAQSIDRCDGTTPTPLRTTTTAEQTNDTLSTSSNETVVALNETEKKPVIATFDEWTKQKLKKEQLNRQPLNSNATPSQTASQPGTPNAVPQAAAPAPSRNYASKECGAKVLLSNPEAENTKAVLNDKEMDEYMRNPCDKAPAKFLIVELCETIQPQRIELANLELFSSSPREVRVFAAERYPVSEWVLVAELQLADVRQLQSFAIQKAPYAKFIKLELQTHFGNEHYCTLSLLKVLGMSMVDEYELEAQSTLSEVVAAQSQNEPAAPSVQLTNPPLDTPQTLPTQSPPAVSSSSIELPTQQQSQSPPISEPKPNEADKISIQAQQESKPEERKSEPSEKNLSGSAVEVIGKVVNGELLHEIVNKVKNLVAEPIKGKAKVDKKKRKLRSRLASCTRCPRRNSQPKRTDPFCRAFFPDHVANYSTSKNPRYNSRELLNNFWRRRHDILRKNSLNSRKKLPMHKAKETMEKFAEHSDAAIQKQQAEESKNEMKIEENSKEKTSSAFETAPLQPESSSTQTTQPAATLQQPPAAVPSQAATDSLINSPSTTASQKPSLPSDSIADLQNQAAQQPVLPATSLSHKESVFMKLNKRIATLEQNMSLSQEYLSELSRQYVEQTEQQGKALEEAKRAAEKMLREAVEQSEQANVKQISTLQSEVDTLLEWMHSQQKSNAAVTVWRKQSEAERMCAAGQEEALERFILAVDQKLDSMWTTEQVVCLIVLIQVVTFSLQSIVNWIAERRKSIEKEQEDQELKHKELETRLLKRVNRILCRVKREVRESDRRRKLIAAHRLLGGWRRPCGKGGNIRKRKGKSSRNNG